MDKNKLLNFFIEVFPDFKNVWDSDNNLFRDENDFTAHGVCAEFSHYFQDNFTAFSNDQLKTLFDKIEKLSINNNDIKNAIYTCFLENIAGTDSSNFSKPFLEINAENFIKQFE